jgi:DNA-binding CsgD family transcriptional regulator
MAPVLPNLTDRQEQTLALSARGLTIKEIAHRMGIAAWTAKHHRDAAVARLGAVNVTHAVAIWTEARRSRSRTARPPRGQQGLDL